MSIPDDVVVAAKAAGLNISRLATSALAEELDRQAKVAELDAHLERLESEFGPISAEDAAAAAEWADRLEGSSAAEPRRSA